MKTLELKEIAGYLAYGLMLETQTDEGRFIGEFNGLDGYGNFSSSIGMANAYGRIEDNNIKPILRPMSDLTREITHKGEKFVPMDKISSIYIPRRSSTGKTFGLYTERATDSSQWMAIIDHLNEWMFDYRGLIYQGLAIDVNTLKVNCYE